MMGFLGDEEGRIPFSVIGIVMILLSTAILLFLVSAEHSNVVVSAGQERERGLSDVMSLSSGDMETALNYAGMYAMSTVGENPVVNASADYEIDGAKNHTAKEINLDRIRKLTLSRFTKYMDNNYDGSYYYGDYNVTVVPTSNASLVDIMPGVMTLARNPMAKHPLMPHNNYTVYYIVSVPANVTIRQRGSDFNYSYDHDVTTMITSRYPLLEGLTSEYEERMNGSNPLNTTPFFMDVTAGSFAYTWIGGYTQYAYGEPLNIISTNNTELLVNGANLLEQGAVYNSVDPVSVADLVLALFGKEEDVEQCNEYNMTNMSTNNSKTAVNETGEPPREYDFNIEDMLDSAYGNLMLGTKVKGVTTAHYVETTINGAYTCQMYMKVVREDLTGGDGITYGDGKQSNIFGPYPLTACDLGDEYAAYGEWYKVYVNNSPEDCWGKKVTIWYIVDHTSMLQYELDSDSELYPGGDYNSSNPTLTNTQDDVINPYEEYYYSYPSPGMPRVTIPATVGSFHDPNAENIVDNYKKTIEYNGIIDGILYDRDKSRHIEMFYSGFDGQTTAPDLVEVAADAELTDLRNEINQTIHVTLNQDDYKDHPWDMPGVAYREMWLDYDTHYDQWLDQDAYMVKTDSGYPGLYKSCGCKALYHIRMAFLNDVKAQLQNAMNNSNADLKSKIDQELQKQDKNMSTDQLANNSRDSDGYLNPDSFDTSLKIPFGLMMTLQSQREFDNNINYGWTENVTLVLDQKPAYLPMTYYENDKIGYAGYPVKTRNICLFSLPTDSALSLGVDRLTETITAPIMDGIDAAADYAVETGNETVIKESGELIDNLISQSKENINAQIRNAIHADPELGKDLTDQNISDIVNETYNERGGNTSRIAQDLRDGKIQQEIADRLGERATENLKLRVQNSLEKHTDEYIDYYATKTKNLVIVTEQKAISKTVYGLRDKIEKTFTDFTKKALEKTLSAGMKKALGRIPNGLPLLPPWGWWATLNVWYIDVHGEVPYLAVYDTDTSIPNPIFGHEAQFYTRYNQQVRDENLTLIGYNKPISFQTQTCTFIVVPPGTQGVGDKIGGWEEKSEGYGK